MKYTLGVDDAGRGPIIGPMVISGALFAEEKIPDLKRLNLKDSKMLSPKQREIALGQIKELAKGYKIVKITPLEIDTREENGMNLNDLEALKMAESINFLTKGLKDIEVIIDCPSVNTVAWKAKLLEFIEEPEGKRFRVEHKADENYPECAAASIIAKVARDTEIQQIKEQIKVDFGSGYPADPKTQKFLKERAHKYLKFGIIRETWQTWKNVLKQRDQKNLF